MNNAEAKFILQGYRPNGADAGDATFCAAIEQAQNDPALAEWFARQRSFDAVISDKLAQVIPPADLRAAILAGGRATAAGTPSRNWWNQPLWMGLAASVAVIIATGVALWPKQAAAFDEFALADARLSATHGHTGHGDATQELQRMLSQPTTRLGQKLPLNFATLYDTGCRSLNYRDRAVLEVCFNRNGQWFHCYISKVADFPDVVNSTPTLVDKGNATIASWRDADHIIVVVSKTGRKHLEALL